MKRFTKWCKEHRSEIYSGVLCTLITTAFFKGIDWLKNVVPTAGNSLVRALSDGFYQTLAQQSDTTIITLLFSTAFGVFIAFTFYPIIKAFSEISKGIKVAMAAANPDKTLENMEQDRKSKQPEKAKEPTETKEEELIKRGKQLLCTIKKTRVKLVISTVSIVLYLAWVVVYQIVPSSMWSVYQKDIVKITPYIEEKVLQMIESDWACMQNKSDYDDVYARINEIKEINQLP